MTVNKTSMEVAPELGGFDYHEYDFADDIEDAVTSTLAGVAGADVNTVIDNLEIIIYKVGAKGNDEVSKVEDAGSYVVEVIYTAPTTIVTEKDAILANYNNYKATFNFKVSQAPVTVTILEDKCRSVASFDETGAFVLPETLTITFKYDFADAYKAKYGVDSDDLDAKNFQVQFTSGDKKVAANKVMTGAGAYEFVIEYLEKGNTTLTDAGDGYSSIQLGVGENPATNVDGNYRLSGNYGAYTVSVLTLGNEDFMIEYLDGVGVVASGVSLKVEELTEWVESDEMYNYFMDIDTFTPYVSTASHTATLEVVMHLRMMQNKNVVQPNGTVYVTLYLYLEHDVDEYAFYQVGEDGYLHMLEDYTIDEDGYLEFTTDRIDSIAVFHLAKVEPAVIEEGLPEWIWYAVGGGGGGAVALASGITGIVVGKKKKAKKMAEGDDTPDDTPDGDKPEEEKKEEAKPEEPKKEEVKPEPTPAPKAEEPKAPEAPKAEEPKAEPTPEPAPEPVKPRPSKPSVVGKKKPPVIGQKVMAEGVDPATAVSAAAPKATPAPQPAPAPKAAPAPQPTTPAPKVEAPKAEAPKAPPVVGDKKPPVVGQKPATPEAPKADAPKAPPVVGKKPPVIGNK